MRGKGLKHYHFGQPNDVLRMVEKKIRNPKEDEVIVKMIVRPINPSDLIPIRGSYSHRITLPHIPGYEGVGIVVAIGSAVPKTLLGKRVLPLRGEGTWQEYVITSAKYAVLVPDNIDNYTAAQLYINPLTAWIICTEILELQANDTLLVNAGGSAIGQIFVQLATILGFKIIAVTRNKKYSEDLFRFGALHVIDTSHSPLYETVKKLTKGKGANAAIDMIGGLAGNELASCLQPNGHFLSLGLLSGKQIDWKRIITQAKVRVSLFHLRHWNKASSLVKWQATFNQVIQFVSEKKLHLAEVAASYDLLEFAKAINHVEQLSKDKKGKIFLTND